MYPRPAWALTSLGEGQEPERAGGEAGSGGTGPRERSDCCGYKFWHQRWERNEIAFHQRETNPLLVKYFDVLSLSNHFPPSVEELDPCLVVRDANGQQLGYFYFEEEPGQRSAAKLPSNDEGVATSPRSVSRRTKPSTSARTPAPVLR